MPSFISVARKGRALEGSFLLSKHRRLTFMLPEECVEFDKLFAILVATTRWLVLAISFAVPQRFKNFHSRAASDEGDAIPVLGLGCLGMLLHPTDIRF